MPIFYSNTASLGTLQVTGSVVVTGSGAGFIKISGSQGGIFGISDVNPAGFELLNFSSASVSIFTINNDKSVRISGSLIVTGSITGSLLGSASYATTAAFALNAGGGAGSTITIADEGTSQGTATFLNFIGNAVTATVASNTASLTISTGSTVSTVAGTTNQIAVNGGTAAVNGAVTLALPSTTNLGAASSFTATSLTGSLTASSLIGTITNAQLQNSTISGRALGTSLLDLTAGTGVTYDAGTTYNGGTARTINIGQAVGTTSNVTFGTVTGTNGLTGSLTASSLQGLINNNQLRNSTISGISLGGNLAALTNGSGISSAGTYDGSTARTFALDINGLTAESAIVDGDTFAFYDASVTANRKATADNIRDYVVSGISGDLTITNAGVATVSRATTVNVTSDTTNNNFPLIFANNGTAIGLLNNTDLNYNPSTKTLRLTGSLLVSGNISAVGEVTAYGTTSDIRYKKNIAPISNSTEKVTNISGVHFEWIENSDVHLHSGKDVGVIAQEIEKVLPEAVFTRDNGVKLVKYEKIIPLLIESIKELQSEITNLKSRLKNLENN